MSENINVENGQVVVKIRADATQAEKEIERLKHKLEEVQKTILNLQVKQGGLGVDNNSSLIERYKIEQDIKAEKEKQLELEKLIQREQIRGQVNLEKEKLRLEYKENKEYREKADKDIQRQIKEADKKEAEAEKKKTQEKKRKEREEKKQQTEEDKKKAAEEKKKIAEEKDKYKSAKINIDKLLSNISRATGVDTSGISKLLNNFGKQALGSDTSKLASLAEITKTTSKISMIAVIATTIYKALQTLYKAGEEAYKTNQEFSNTLLQLNNSANAYNTAIEAMQKGAYDAADALKSLAESSSKFIQQGVNTQRGEEIGQAALNRGLDIAATLDFTVEPSEVANKITDAIKTGSGAEQYGIYVSDDIVKAWVLATKGVNLYTAQVSQAQMVQYRFEKAMEDTGAYAGVYESKLDTAAKSAYQANLKLEESFKRLKDNAQGFYEGASKLFSAFKEGFSEIIIEPLAEFFENATKAGSKVGIADEIKATNKDILEDTNKQLKAQQDVNAAYAKWGEYLERVKNGLFGFEEITNLSAYIGDTTLDKNVSAKISAQFDETTTKSKVKNAVNDINKNLGKIKDVKIKADINEATGKVRGFSQIITDVDGKTIEIYNEFKDEMELKEFERLINDELPDDKQISINANTGYAEDNLGRVANIMDILIEDAGSYEEALNKLSDITAKFTDKTVGLEIKTTGLDYDALLNIKNVLEGITNKTVTIDFEANTNSLDAAQKKLDIHLGKEQKIYDIFSRTSNILEDTEGKKYTIGGRLWDRLKSGEEFDILTELYSDTGVTREKLYNMLSTGDIDSLIAAGLGKVFFQVGDILPQVTDVNSTFNMLDAFVNSQAGRDFAKEYGMTPQQLESSVNQLRNVTVYNNYNGNNVIDNPVYRRKTKEALETQYEDTY